MNIQDPMYRRNEVDADALEDISAKLIDLSNLLDKAAGTMRERDARIEELEDRVEELESGGE